MDADPGFDEFVAAEGDGLLRLAYLLTTAEEPAAAILEDALARTYGCWPRLAAASADPQEYVRRILVHEVTDGHRFSRSMPLDSVPAYATDDDLVIALRALPADERAATVLRHCLDLSEMETAATLGCTVGAVRRQTMRALARLRDLVPTSTPSGRPAASSLVELMRHLKASLATLPDRLELQQVRPMPELLRRIRSTHARRALRRRTVVLGATATLVLIITLIVLQVATGGLGSV